jgi:hypothetical protein
MRPCGLESKLKGGNEPRGVAGLRIRKVTNISFEEENEAAVLRYVDCGKGI